MPFWTTLHLFIFLLIYGQEERRFLNIVGTLRCVIFPSVWRLQAHDFTWVNFRIGNFTCCETLKFLFKLINSQFFQSQNFAFKLLIICKYHFLFMILSHRYHVYCNLGCWGLNTGTEEVCS